MLLHRALQIKPKKLKKNPNVQGVEIAREESAATASAAPEAAAKPLETVPLPAGTAAFTFAPPRLHSLDAQSPSTRISTPHVARSLDL